MIFKTVSGAIIAASSSCCEITKSSSVGILVRVLSAILVDLFKRVVFLTLLINTNESVLSNNELIIFRTSICKIISLAEISLVNDSLSWHLSQNDSIRYSRIIKDTFSEDSTGDRWFVLDLRGRILLVWRVPAGASLLFLLSVYPRISLVVVGSLVVNNGVSPWVLVVLTVLVIVTKMGSI